MLIGLVIWAQVMTIGAALAIWKIQTQRADHAEAQAREWAERAAKVKPVIVPAPDLVPYLDRLGEMTRVMVSESLTAVASVINGPPQPAGGPTTEQIVEGAMDREETDGQFDIWTPPWESDSWVEPGGEGESVDVTLNGNQ